MDLPDETLKHIYYKNALKIIPGMDASLFPGGLDVGHRALGICFTAVTDVGHWALLIGQ